ncbi:hypothetical protein GCM10010230_17740 [Streptomyces narbonensis]|nr:hypothetical protein GCM10010230_17740 [Streptomyces narbonensis]
MHPQRLGRAEARVLRDPVDGQAGGLQEVPGALDALLGEPLPGADPDLVAEAAGERPYAHRLLPGQVPQLDRLVEVGERPRPGRGRGVRAGLGKGPLDVLGLSAVPVRRYDGPSGDVVGDGRAVVAAHDVQAQVDAGGHARRGEDVAVVDEEHVGVDPHAGEEPLEVRGGGPVGGGRAPVEEPGGGEHVPAGADGDEPGAGPDVREGGGELLGEPALLVDRAELVRGGDDDRVGGGEDLGAVLHVHGEVGVGGDGAGDRGAGDDLVQERALGVPGAAEDAVRDAQLEGEEPGQGEDGDAVGRPRHGGGSFGSAWAGKSVVVQTSWLVPLRVRDGQHVQV